MRATGSIPGFLPSVNGLPFPNHFADAPAIRIRLGPLGPIGIGNAGDGLCGGMCRVAVARWRRGEPPPAQDRPPLAGSPLFRAIVRAQVESLDGLRAPLRFYSLQAFRPERPDPLARVFGRRTRTHETVRAWRSIRAAIDAGEPAIVGLVRALGTDPRLLPRHHQVVAWAYEVENDRLRLRIYDPNHPGRDDVELRLRLAVDRRWPATMLQTTGEPLEAFFHLA